MPPKTESPARRKGANLMEGFVADRRTMLQAAAVLSTVLARPALAREARPGSSPVRFVVTDGRFGESMAFAREMAQLGAERLEVTDGLTALWQEHLVPHWRDQRGIVVGLTTRAVWDGLSQQALGQFRRPRLLGDHRFNGSSASAAHHKLALPAGILGPSGAALLEADTWPGAMAILVRHCAELRLAGEQTCEAGRQDLARAASNQLVSWMVM